MLDTSRNQKPSIPRVASMKNPRKNESTSDRRNARIVTASGSGLDPDLSPAAARLQVARVARARALPESDVRALVERSVQPPLVGVWGAPRVSVWDLNLGLERLSERVRP